MTSRTAFPHCTQAPRVARCRFVTWTQIETVHLKKGVSTVEFWWHLRPSSNEPSNYVCGAECRLDVGNGERQPSVTCKEKVTALRLSRELQRVFRLRNIIRSVNLRNTRLFARGFVNGEYGLYCRPTLRGKISRPQWPIKKSTKETCKV